MSTHGPEKQHKFTPKGLLSPSSITKLLLELTSGEITSRAGLDNIDVIKGDENFDRMSQIADILTEIIDTDDAKATSCSLKERIDKSREFHKLDFINHLKLEDVNSRCMCIECGLYDEKLDQIQCKKNREHENPCECCQESFELIITLMKLHGKAESTAELSGRYTSSPALEDDMESMKHEITLCMNNLIDYRAHLVHKFAESKFDEHFYDNLKSDEAVVICDWKMKILAAKYREAQAEWFSKRGISLLGFEIHRKVESGKMETTYHFFVTDDTTQDAEAVICAKHYLYTKILPNMDLKKVHYRSDGAGCFSSKEAKAMMAVWDDIAKAQNGAYEVSYKVSVAGCGKTALDGLFGVLTMHLLRLVNHGHSYEKAEDIFRILQEFPLQHTHVHLFTPQRNQIPIPKPKDDSGLSNFHLVLYDRKSQIATAKYFSDYSKDVYFQKATTLGLKKTKTVAPVISSCINATILDASAHVVKSTYEIGTNLSVGKLNTVSYDERMIQLQRSRMFQNNARLDVKNAVRDVYMEKRGLYCCPVINDTSKSRCMKIFTSKSGMETHIASNKHKFPQSSFPSWVHELHLSGKFAFTLAVGSRRNRSGFVQKERGGPTIEPAKKAPNHFGSVTQYWYSSGCYRKRSKDQFRATPALKDDLETLFIQGFQTDGPKKGRNKYTPEQALVTLKNLKIDDGRRKYSHAASNRNGPLPTKQYIQGWFSRRKNKMAEDEKKRAQAFERARIEVVQGAVVNVEDNQGAETLEGTQDAAIVVEGNQDTATIAGGNQDAETNIDEDIDVAKDFENDTLLNEEEYLLSDDQISSLVKSRLRVKRFTLKAFCKRLLEIDDTLYKREPQSYDNMKTGALQKICQERNLPSDSSKQAMIIFLQLDDRVQTLTTCMPDVVAIILKQDSLVEGKGKGNIK